MLGQCKTILIIERQPPLIIGAIKQRSIERLTDDKCRYQAVSPKDMAKSRRTGAILLKKSFQYAHKLLSAEPLALNV